MNQTITILASVEEIVLGVAFIGVFGLVQLPYDKIDGNPVPTIIFKSKPTFFHAFVLSLNFAFTAAVLTMSLRDVYPRVASYCRQLAILSIGTAGGILMYLLLPSSNYMLVSSSIYHSI